MKNAPDAGRIAELLARFDRAGPRYTSYPTAVEFTEEVTAATYGDHLSRAAAVDAPISLYLHLPFCQHRCAFCGCHVIITDKRDVIGGYLDVLHREIDLIADRLGDRNVVRQYHWGGGTPTYLTPEEMHALHAKITSRFRIEEGAEVAIEVDPRVTTPDHLALLRELGFNRLSMGVQDFTPEVQEIITRNQTEAETVELVEACRKLGFESLNLDLIYGLPKQTQDTFVTSLRKVVELRPERVAVYSYAHVPWMKANQRKTEAEFLPDPETKLLLFGEAHSAFVEAGYDPIGMDHFAVPEDELAVAARERRLHRNFMGYTTKPAPDFVGVGISAIGDVQDAFFQNEKGIPAYKRRVMAGEPPIFRGVVLTAEDRLRRDVILSIMCNARIDRADIEARHGIDFPKTFAWEMEQLAEERKHGFVEWNDDLSEIRVVGDGKLFIRNIAMIFDERLRRMKRDGPVFSQTV
ncbi:MAG: oxygen-independent coproporphyrinogen III oxidase [Gemmatimonadota bacterium]|nr:MAG: oxygen-independent coproporphyrinogen III oxidase [Gemmatimonadota bacterium]